jgi:hypothetical protein
MNLVAPVFEYHEAEDTSPPTECLATFDTRLVAFELFAGGPSSGPRIYKWDGLYYPSIAIEVYAKIEASAAGEDGSAVQLIERTFSGGGDNGVTCTIDGKTFPLGISDADDFTEVLGTGASATAVLDIESSVLEITPALFWPYDPGDGMPVWHVDTGERLRDPSKIVMRNGVLVYLP